MLNLNLLCDEVRKIAKASGSFLKEGRKGFDSSKVEEKSAHNYVSYMDKTCEKQIVEALSKLLPEAGFIAEEGTATHTGESYCWIIDPLDGTSNYIHDMAPYCVSIALQYQEEMLLGVVYEVCRDECFHTIKGGKSYLDNEEINVSEVSALSDAFVALGFPYSFNDYKPMALHLVNNLYGIAGGTRLLGSAAAELCYVACGRFDARIEAFLGPWDVAAGALILQNAGGKITDFKGGDNWQSGNEVLASNGRLHETLMSFSFCLQKPKARP